MASLIENLITQLNEEYAVYEKLYEVSLEKTPAIIANDLAKLTEVTDKEQLLVDTVTGMENSRINIMKNIASVINKKYADLKVSDIVEFLDGQPQFQEPLAQINEKLGKIAKKLQDVNRHNENLIKEALSMIEYNINLLQNLNRAPETAEYSKDMFRGKAGSYGGGMDSSFGAGMGKFDAKQ